MKVQYFLLVVLLVLLATCTPDRRADPRLARLPLIEIDIAPEHMVVLRRKRAEALREGMLVSKAKDYVAARLIFQSDTMLAQTRLKGDWLDHLKGGKWSMRFKLADQDALLGMRRFSIQHPRTRSFLDEWVYHRLLEQEGILATQYHFVQVVLNGRYKGLYALEEHFDKTLLERQGRREAPILKFNEEGFWEIQKHHKRSGDNLSPYLPDFEAADVEAFQKGKTLRDSFLRSAFVVGRELLQAYRFGKRPAAECWDMDQMARLYALADIGAAYHSLRWHNLRMYFNPFTGRLEPVIYDAYSSNGPYRWFSKAYLGFYNERYSKVYFKEEYFVFQLFNDLEFRDLYIEYLKKYSEAEFINSFFSKIGERLNLLQEALQSEYPGYQYQDSLLLGGAQKMRDSLRSYRRDHPPFEYEIFDALYDSCRLANPLASTALKAVPIGSGGRIALANYFCQPIEIQALGPKKSKPIHPLSLPRELSSFTIYQVPPKTLQMKAEGSDRYVFYTVPGNENWFSQKISEWPARKRIRFLDVDSLQIDQLKIQRSESLLRLQAGRYQINQAIVIPQDYRLIIEAGTQIELNRGAAIFVFGGLEIAGSSVRPVRISSSDGSGRGLHIINPMEPVKLQHVRFDSLQSWQEQGLLLSGAVTFYGCQGRVEHCQFENSPTEDALNIVNSDSLQLKNIHFAHCRSDALDIDFSIVQISDCQFESIGGDGLDCSASEVRGGQLRFHKIGDKALSIGENSGIVLKELAIQEASIGIAVKDGSRAMVASPNLKNCRLGMAVYQKKAEFPLAKLAAHTVTTEGAGELYWLEEGHQLLWEGKVLEATHGSGQLRELLYE